MNEDAPQQRRAYPALSLVYALTLPKLRAIAREHGYALALHGSMETDADLLACPWTNEATDAETLIEALRTGIGGFFSLENGQPDALRAHGRKAWAIY